MARNCKRRRHVVIYSHLE